MKLTEEDKRDIIKSVEKGITRKQLAADYHIGVKHIENLVKKYKLHGEAAIVCQPKRYYSHEYKEKIVNQYLNGMSKQRLSIMYNLRYSTVARWIKKYKDEGYNGLQNKKKGGPGEMKEETEREKKKTEEEKTAEKAKIKMLERRNKELEAEVAYLKKLDALIQEREKRESPKK